eukprot:gene7966-9466_t
MSAFLYKQTRGVLIVVLLCLHAGRRVAASTCADVADYPHIFRQWQIAFESATGQSISSPIRNQCTDVTEYSNILQRWQIAYESATEQSVFPPIQNQKTELSRFGFSEQSASIAVNTEVRIDGERIGPIPNFAALRRADVRDARRALIDAIFFCETQTSNTSI